MTAFSDRFGGTQIQPADVAYRYVLLQEDQITQWPPYATVDNVLAKTMDVAPVLPNLSVWMPDAREASPGETVIFYNNSAFAYFVFSNLGNPIATVAPGSRRLLLLTDNTTQEGSWLTTILGAGTGTLDIAGAAGAGLRAVGTTLQVAFPVITVPTSRAVVEGDRDRVLVWTGGSGILTLPPAGSLVDFNIEVRNQGTGTLTLQPTGQNIDGVSAITLNVEESLWLHSASLLNFWTTVGRGRNTNFAFTQLNKTVSGGVVALTLTEAANVVQTYTGALTSDVDVILPSIVQVYYVTNKTTGAFNLKFRNIGPGTSVILPQLQSVILFSDGTNVSNASTTQSGVQQVAYGAGTVSAPSVSINGVSNGFFSPASGAVSFTSNGTEVLAMNGNGVVVTKAASPILKLKATGGDAFITVERPAGSNGGLQISTNTTPRWIVYAGGTESGANAGSDYNFNRYDDAGTFLGTPLQIIRSTGEIVVNGPLRQKAQVGELKYFVGGAIGRSGFLLADGSLVGRTSYPDLWAYAQAVGVTDEGTWSAGYFGYFSSGNGSTTFRIPDLRGLFLRGLDNGRGLDPSRPWGYYQDQQNLSHTHGVSDPSHTHGVNDPQHAHSIADGGHGHGVNDPTHNHDGWTGEAGWHGHGVSDGGHGHGSQAYNTANVGGSYPQMGAGVFTSVGSGVSGSGSNIGIAGDGTHTHGVGIGGRATGISVAGAGTGIGIYGAGTGVYLSYAGTGISIAASGGEAHPRNMAYPLYIRY
jgi:hypothetical protein